MANTTTDSRAGEWRRTRSSTGVGAGPSTKPDQLAASPRPSSPTVPAPREREGSWWWLLAIIPLVLCCGGPLILAALATVSATTLGAAGGIAGGVLGVVAVSWWWVRRRRNAPCCPLPGAEGER